MAFTRRKLWGILLPTLVAVVSVLLFIGFVALAIVGLVFETYEVVSKERTSFYILGGATGISVLCSILMTFATALRVNTNKKVKMVKRLADVEQRRQSSVCVLENEVAAAEEEETEDEREGDEEKGRTAQTEDMIDGPSDAEWRTSRVRNFTPHATFTLFMFFQCVFLTILSVMWTVVVANNNTGIQTSPWPYLFCELIAGVLAPIFLLLAGIFGGVVLKFITKGEMDASHLLTTLLPAVALEHTKNESYWVIAGTYYYKINKPECQPSSKKYRLSHAWDSSLSTWCLTAVLASSLIIAVSYFANATIAEIRLVDSCQLLGPEIKIYSCFTQLRLDFVNCSDPENDEEDIHCFKFLDFINEADPIASLLEAIVLYLLTVEIFDVIFKGVRILLRIKSSKLWGRITLALGLIIFVLSLLLIVFSYGFGFDLALSRQLQLVVIGVAVSFTGILLVRGKWREKEHVEEAPESIELVSLEAVQFTQLPSDVSSDYQSDERNSPTSEEIGVEEGGHQDIGVEEGGHQDIGVEEGGHQENGVEEGGHQENGVEEGGHQEIGVEEGGNHEDVAVEMHPEGEETHISSDL